MKLQEIKTNLLMIKSQSVMEKELVSGLAYIRNIVILGRGKSVSAEILCEELADVCPELKPAFQDMGHFLHINDMERAGAVLYKYIGTGISKDLGRFLAGWDLIPAEQLLGTVEIYFDSMRENIICQRQKRNEILSDIIYFPVVINAMLVLLNFVYVAFYIEQQGMLKNLYM